MTCCLLIMLWVTDELSYDGFHEQKNHIHRVNSEQHLPNKTTEHELTPAPLAPALKNEFPEIVEAGRITRTGNILVKADDKAFFEEEIAFADSSLFTIFTFPFLYGDPETALDDPHSAVISEDIANKFFASRNPVDQFLNLNNKLDLKVTGVIKNIPHNSHFRFDIFASFKLLATLGADLEEWRSLGYNTYVLLHKNANLEEVNQKIHGVIQKYSPGYNFTLHLQPLSQIRLYGIGGGGTIRYVYIFSVIACFVLLIACINFMNLTTALAGNRFHEIGVRKVVGAKKKDLINQFLSESVLLSFISMAIALGAAWLLLPVFNNATGKQLALNSREYSIIILGLIPFTALVGFFSGSYPAFYLSSFNPVKALKGNLFIGHRRALPRKLLAVTQYALAIILIIGTIVIYNQINYMKNKNLGFDREEIVYIPLRGNIKQKLNTAKVEWQKSPNISGVSFTSQIPTYMPSGTQGLDWEGKDPDKTAYMRWIAADNDYIETLGLELIAGKNFTNQTSTTDAGFIVNEEAVELMGITNPVGHQFTFSGFQGEIIAVVKNYHYAPLNNKIQPLVLSCLPGLFNYGLVKINPGRLPGAIRFLEDKWNDMEPGIPFEYGFLDAEFDKLYKSEQQAGMIASYFTIMALFIAGLGLLGLSAYMAKQRTKEIGIRKVLGASAANIVGLLSKEYISWIIAANILGWPVAYFAATRWLQNYAYRACLGIWIFVLSTVMAFIIAFIPISYHAVKAALANPVISLRYE
jgi:putative ABC transport system permease protein